MARSQQAQEVFKLLLQCFLVVTTLFDIIKSEGFRKFTRAFPLVDKATSLFQIISKWFDQKKGNKDVHFLITFR